MSERTLGLIGSAAGGVEQIRPALIEPAISRITQAHHRRGSRTWRPCTKPTCGS